MPPRRRFLRGIIESNLWGKLWRLKASVRQMWSLIVRDHFAHSNGKYTKENRTWWWATCHSLPASQATTFYKFHLKIVYFGQLVFKITVIFSGQQCLIYAVSCSRLYSDGAPLVGSCPLTGCMWLQMTSFIGRFTQSPNPKYIWCSYSS